MAHEANCMNTKECICSAKDCSRRGRCCECIEHHKEQGNLPACMRGLK